MHNVIITDVDGNVIHLPYGDEPRCDNCGKVFRESQCFITGGELCETEWACCEACYNEMIQMGCTFEENGDGVFRKQKY